MANAGVSYCARLKEYADTKRCTVQYSVSGPHHMPMYTAKVCIQGAAYHTKEATGTGTTKKAAKNQAAGALLALIRKSDHPDVGDVVVELKVCPLADQQCLGSYLHLDIT